MMIKTRFAPSPTGSLHLGGVRTALYAWAFAKKNKGSFLLRIEDSDFQRSTKQSTEGIFQGLQWLGLTPDNMDDVLYQSQNLPRYQQVVQDLLDKGLAYPCYCDKDELEQMRNDAIQTGSHAYNGKWRPEMGKVLPDVPAGVNPVIRFKMPQQGETVWFDQVKGEIRFANMLLDDFIIMRSDNTPTYNLCVVVDDIDMAITHVIRGDDHVNNTPKQIQLFKALGYDVPTFAHLPMLLDKNGNKLSKRKTLQQNNDDFSAILSDYQDDYLPSALLNYLAKLGWGHDDNEVFSMEEFINWFDLNQVSSAPTRVDLQKLIWINKKHIQNSNANDLYQMFQWQTHPIETQKVIKLFQSRANTLQDIKNMTEQFFQFKFDQEKLNQQDCQIVQEVINEINNIKDDQWTQENIKNVLNQVINKNQLKFADVGKPLRRVLFGNLDTKVGIDEVIMTMGYQYALKRLNDGLKFYQNQLNHV